MFRSPSLAVGLSAVALFTLEPFVGKVMLPRMGGTPMVWNTCVLVFQMLLLVGYWYSVHLGRMEDVRAAARRHRALVIVAALSWPLTVRALWMSPWPGVHPVIWIAAVCVIGIGLPFVLLSATSPLAQVWLARDRTATTPVHRLYAVSNFGSVVGLIAYVAVVEPLLGVGAQSWVIWAVGVAGMGLVGHQGGKVSGQQGAGRQGGRVSGRQEKGHQGDKVSGPQGAGSGAAVHLSTLAPAPWPPDTLPPWHPLLWFSLSFAASLCLFSVNTFLATDVASFPLLFAVPLVLFLLAFAGGFSAWAERAGRWLQVVAMGAGGAALWYLLRVATPATSVLDLPLPLVALFGLVLALAARLAASRPDDAGLPTFYTVISAGGVAAGVVSVVLLPWMWTRVTAPLHELSLLLVTSTVPEYPLAIVLGLWLVARGWPMRVLAAVATIMVCTATAPTYGMSRPFEARNFYGTLRVQLDPSTSSTRLTNGTTLHGFEIRGGNGDATSYYHPSSPIGQIMQARHPRRVMAMGLGVGTLAAYAVRGEHYTFLEINPLVEDVATRSGYFTFVERARKRGAEIEVRLGDGRLLAAGLPDEQWDMIVLDAFSSDSIPVHLLTLEAFREYARKASARGVIAVHVSNRFFDLGPMVAASAEAIGWRWAIQSRTADDPAENSSTWVMLVRDDQVAESLGLTALPWTRPTIPAGVRPWTDDWGNLLGRLKVVAERLHTTFESQ